MWVTPGRGEGGVPLAPDAYGGLHESGAANEECSTS